MKNKYVPFCESMPNKILLSSIVAMDVLAPFGGKSAPIILEPLPKPPIKVIMS